MTEKIKQLLPSILTGCLIASYFGCYGYYNEFKVDIFSFLSLEDLTMIFLKWIILPSVFFLLVLGLIYRLFKNIGSGATWWDKKISNSTIKRRVFVLLPVVILLITFLLYYNLLKIVALLTIGMLFVAFLLLIFIFYIVELFLNENKETNITDWGSFLSLGLFFVIFIPIVSGIVISHTIPQDKIIVELEGGQIINTTGKSNLVYIGKTSNYFFINDSKSQSTKAYRMDKIRYFEFSK